MTSPQRPPGASALTRVTALASLIWLVAVLLLYCLSAADTFAANGFVGAREAREEIGFFLAASAFALVAVFVLDTLRVPAPGFLAVACVAIAATLTVLTHQETETLMAAVLLGLSWSLGDWLLRRFDLLPEGIGGPAALALAVGAGLAALSYALLAVTLAGLLSDLTIGLLLAGAASTLAFRSRLPAHQRVLAGPERSSPVELTALTALCAGSLLGFAVCLTPQVNFDALHYHFAMPLAWLGEGSFVERPDIIQSYFPLGLEMVYTPAFRIGDEATANLVHWAYAPLAAVLLWGAADHAFGRPAGAIAAAFYGLMPLVVWESTAATSDLALSFYLIAAVYLLARAGRPCEPRFLFAAGLLGGVALSFKIVALLFLPALAVSAAVVLAGCWSPKAGWRALKRPLAAFAAGGLFTGAPWLLLRWLQTGNPVLPLFNNLFQSDRWPPVNERFDLAQFGIGTSPGDFLIFWWQASADSSRFGQPVPDWVIGVPLLASLAAVLVLPGVALARSALVWLFAAAVFLLFWFGFSQYLRYGLPALALLSPVASVALVEALRRLRLDARVAEGVLVAFVALLLACGAIVAAGSFSLVPRHFPTEVLLGRESAAAYRRDWVLNYNAISFFDAETAGTREAGVILGFPYNYFAANRLYDYIVPSTLSPFRRIVEAGLGPDETAAALVAADIRWLIYDSNNPFAHDVWPPAWIAESVLAPDFVAKHLQVRFDENGVRVYRVVPGAAAGATGPNDRLVTQSGE